MKGFMSTKIKDEKKPKVKMSTSVKYTMIAMLLVIIFMAIVFNFGIPLIYTHTMSSKPNSIPKANVLLWPIKQFVEMLVYKWFGISENSQWGSVLSFFITEVPFILLLLFTFSYLFNFARGFSTDAELSEWMQSKDGFMGRIVGSIMGFVSPFCSCSTIPVVTSLVRARTPFGTMMAFLITSPMINEVGVVLLWQMLGYKVALLYMAFGFFIGFVGSYFATLFKLEDQIKLKLEEVTEKNKVKRIKMKTTFNTIHRKAIYTAKDLFKSFWWILIIAMAIGSLMHGLIPANWIQNNVGNKWWTPLVLIPFGLLLYLNIAATLPITNSFVRAGLGLGSALGFTMAVNTMSLPEMFMLSKIFKKKFMVFFMVYLLIAILLFSYIILVIPDSVLI